MKIEQQIRGSFYALALGDGLGYQVEFNSSVTPSTPGVKVPTGLLRFSDDTQMTYAVARGLIAPIEDQEPYEERSRNVARAIADWYDRPLGGSHRAPGGSCSAGAGSLRRMFEGRAGMDWRRAGTADGKGCGVAMRSAPYGWLLPTASAVQMAADHALMTHRTASAMASGAAVAATVSLLMRGCRPWDAAEFAAQVAARYDQKCARLIWEALYQAVVRPPGYEHAAQHDTELFDRFRGWLGDEAVAAALYAFLVHHDSVEECLLLAANTPGDSDSIACIAGAFVGIQNPIPDGWLKHIEQREALDDLTVQCAAWVEQTQESIQNDRSTYRVPPSD